MSAGGAVSDFRQLWLFAHGNICRRANRCFGFGGCGRSLGLSRCISDWGLGEHWVFRCWWCHRDVSWRSCQRLQAALAFRPRADPQEDRRVFRVLVWPESRVERCVSDGSREHGFSGVGGVTGAVSRLSAPQASLPGVVAPGNISAMAGTPSGCLGSRRSTGLGLPWTGLPASRVEPVYQ